MASSSSSSIIIIMIQIWILFWWTPLSDAQTTAKFTGDYSDVLTIIGIKYSGSEFYIGITSKNNDGVCSVSDYQFGFTVNGGSVSLNGAAPDATTCIHLEFTKGNRVISTSSIISVTFTVIKMLRGIDFKVVVASGKGDYITTASFTRPDGKSGPITITTVSSKFPNNKVTIMWLPPVISNGIIRKYNIVIKKDTSCLLYWTISCSNCENKTVGDGGSSITSECSGTSISSNTFSKDDTSITVNTNDKITPYTNYNVIVQPGNGWGLGEFVIKKFTSGQYKSGPASLHIISTIFPGPTVTLNIIPPNTPNGLISYYTVLIMDKLLSSCLYHWTLSCGNCEGQTVGNGGTAVTTEGCKQQFTTSFIISTTSITLNKVINLIKPYQNYSIIIQPGNKWGWGESSTTKYETSQYESAAVPSPSIVSLFPDNQLVAMWSSPAEPNGNIFQYTVLLKQDTSCMLYWILQCSDCTSQSENKGTHIASTVNGCPAQGISIKFDKTDTSFTVKLNNDTIKPYTKYNIVIQPRNGWGYGQVTNIQFTSGQYKSGSVSKQNAGNSNEDGKYRITWIPPATPNGMVSHYIVLMKLDTSCMVHLDVLCNNCKGQKVGNAGTSIVSNQQCSIKQTRQFNKDDNIIMVDINNYVKQDTTYTIIIQPGNGWGWGEEVTFQFTSTKINVPPKPADDIKIKPQQPPSNINIDKTTQLYIKLPLSAFSKSANIITKFTVVVATLSGSITTESKLETPNSFHDQTYMQCKKKRTDSEDNCVYEVSINNVNKTALQRKKRDTKELEDKAFLLGAIKECKDESSYLCNGLLQPETKYQVSLRAYTPTGFTTLIPTNFTTEKASSTVLIVSVVIITFIVVIVVIIVVVLCIKKPELFKKIINKTKYTKNYDSNVENDVIETETTDTIPMDKVNKPHFICTLDEFEQIISNTTALKSEWATIRDTTEAKYCNLKINIDDTTKPKNRFIDIIPYTHNIIKLTTIYEGDDYINASRICEKPAHWSTDPTNQCQCKNFFIASQGPIPIDKPNRVPTVGDFWRMIVEQQVTLIVNLTLCKETDAQGNTKEKCAQYWPDVECECIQFTSGEETINVTMTKLISNDIYTERIFSVDEISQNKKHTVTQIHATEWKDYSVFNIDHLLTLYDRFNQLRSRRRPTVVHCSAGVGRTGTFILIDCLIRSGELSKDCVSKILKELRQCRTTLVQTADQYILAHKVYQRYLKRFVSEEDVYKAEEECIYFND